MSVFDKHDHECGIVNSVLVQMVKIPLPVVCDKFPTIKFIRLFARMRIFYSLKFKNHTFATESAEKKSVKKTQKQKKLSKLKKLMTSFDFV